MEYNNPFDNTPGADRPPRKELQGPRPPPLRVRKESHKIRKPPMAPPGVVPHQQPPPPQQPRQPVIIYDVSPKVIHANPNDFMNLVQRLTGPNNNDTSSSSSSSLPHHHVISGAISPAARFASIEKTKIPLDGRKFGGTSEVVEGQMMESSSSVVNNIGDYEMERKVSFQGILSPGPSSLPQISPNLFSPYGGAFSSLYYSNMSYFQHGLSNNNNNNNGVQIQHGGIEGSSNCMPSPFSCNNNNNFTSPGVVISPGSLDLLHHMLNG